MIEVLSLGAGVQSTTVLLMSLEGELPPLDWVVFADTGWEPQAVYKHLEWLKTLTTVHVVSNGNIRHKELSATTKDGESARTTMPYFLSDGQREEGRLRRKCTSEYKIVPIERFIRITVLGLAHGQAAPKTKVIRQWYGISLDEMQRMAKDPNKFTSNYYPLVEQRMTRENCIAWLERYGLQDVPRSACIGCPFKHNQEWRKLRDDSPVEWQDAIAFDAAMRLRGGTDRPRFIHRQCVPLDEAVIDRDSPGQLLLWQDECTGMCGV